METFLVSVEIGGVQGGRGETFDMLAGTGSSHSALPASALRRLGVAPGGTARFARADGSVVDMPMGSARTRVGGRGAFAPVAFAPEDFQPTLGWLTLDLLRLEIDPASQRLVPSTKELLM